MPAALPGGLFADTPAARAAGGGFAPVAEFEAVDRTQLFLDDVARIAYEVNVDQRTVKFRDADALQPMGQLSGLPRLVGTEQPQASGGAVDSVHHRLFLPSSPGTIPAQNFVLIIDGSSRSVVGRMPVPSDPLHPMQQVVSLSYDPTRNRVFALLATRPGTTFDTTVVRLSPDDFLAGRPAADGVFPVENCPMPAPSLGNIPGVPSDPTREFAYVVCAYPSAANLTTPRPYQGIARVPLTADGGEVEYTRLAADTAFGGAIFDPGSERMIVASRDFGPRGQFIFDGRHNAVVALVNQTGNIAGSCMNAKTGRYYIAADTVGDALDTGFLIGDTRQTPPDHGVTFPELGPKLSRGPLGCDTRDNRVFVKYAKGDGFVFRVFKDDSPPVVPAPAPDPDLYTHDIADDPATASISFNGVARAFGARGIWVGGAQGTTTNYSSMIGVPGGAEQLGATRSVTLAAIGIGPRSAVLSDGSGAGVAAAGAVRDAVTADEWQHPITAATKPILFNPSLVFRSPENVPFDVPLPWSYGSVECGKGPGEAQASQSSDSASVTCDPRGGRTEASTVFSMDLGPVSIEGATSSATINTDSAKGLVATATAGDGRVVIPALGIELEDVRATVTSQAKGRPGTAASTYTATVGRMILNGTEQCSDCEPQEVAERINAIPGGNVVATVPRADDALAEGTPKGAAAGIIRDRFEQLHDEVINRLSADDQHVPALRLVVQEDAYQHSALVIDLAAPEVATLRALSPCPFCSGGFNDPDEPDEPNEPAFPIFNPPTERSPLDDVLRSSPPLPQPRPRGGGRLIRPILEGIRDAASGLAAVLTDPDRIPLIAAVWSVLAVPVYLSSRRRLLPK